MNLTPNTDKEELAPTAINTPSKPTEAATVFAKLYHQWFDHTCNLTAEAKQRTEQLIGSYVADVLSLWDERTQCWLPESPTILRLESCDIAVFTMRKPHIALHIGCIETDLPLTTHEQKQTAPTAETHSLTLRWKSFHPCSYTMGKQTTGFRFSENKEGLLVAFEVFLSDGGLVRLDSEGITAANHATQHDAHFAAYYSETCTAEYVTRHSKAYAACTASLTRNPLAQVI